MIFILAADYVYGGIDQILGNINISTTNKNELNGTLVAKPVESVNSVECRQIIIEQKQINKYKNKSNSLFS